MKKYTVHIPRGRLPFFTLSDGRTYVDLLWHFGERLEFALDDVGVLLDASRPGELVIARAVDARDLSDVLRHEQDGCGEAMAFLISSEDVRWRRCSRRRQRK